MKILVAEDDAVSRKLLCSCLEHLGDCEAVVNGKAALQAFTEAYERGEPFDVLFLDIMMPELSGHHVLAAVRDFERERSIGEDAAVKVIMTTALNDAENVVGAFQNGCEAYVAKPISKRQILDELKKLGFGV